MGDGVGDGAGDGIVTGTYTYNAREWVTDLNYAGTFKSALTYDPAGNVTRQVYRHGSAASITADYDYDDLYRITGFDVSGGTSQDYAYDKNGNITSLVTGTSTLTYIYSTSATPNRLGSTTGTGGQIYAYNPNGWMTRRGTDTVGYDYRGLTTGYGSARYLMDPDRRRVKKTVGTAVTYYLRGADGSVLAEYSGQTLSARYVYAGTRRIARIAGDSASYYLADHLGSTRSLVDEEGTVTAAYDYWPYGKVLALSGTGSTHFRFTGHERDSESGLDYMIARSYANDIGRFLRPDPMQDAYPGLSPYTYAANNPLKYVDPDGMKILFSSSLSREEQSRLEDYITTLQKSSYGKKIYEDVQSADEIFFIGFSELGADFGGSIEVEFDLEKTERDPRTGRVLKTKVKYGIIGIDEGKILNTPGAMIEGVIGHELYHAWQVIHNAVQYRNRDETQKDFKRNERDNEKEADEIQGFIEEQLKKLFREEDSNE